MLLLRLVASSSSLPLAGDAERNTMQPTSSETATCPFSPARTFVAHHKSGSTIVDEACVRMNKELRALAPACVAASLGGMYIHSDWNGLDLSLPPTPPYADLPYQCCLAEAPPADGALVAHMTRNPFEMVVSSYEYDKDVHSEAAWQDTTMLPVAGEKLSDYLHGYWSAIRHVALLAWDGTFGGALPRPLLNATYTETWFAYVTRVGEDEALLAEALMLSQLSIRPMVSNHAYVASLGAAHGRNTCEQRVDDGTHAECAAFWAETVAWFAYTPADVAAALAHGAANATCTQSDTNRRSTDGEGNATRKAARVLRLRHIDAELLNGTLAAYEAAIGCPLSQRYSFKGDQRGRRVRAWGGQLALGATV